MRRSLALLVALGCSGGGGGGGFTLTLSPHFLEGQDVLDDGPDVELVLRRPGATEVYGLGKASAGAALSVPDIEPLAAGTMVGIALESGGTAGALDAGDAVAYGQALVEDAGAATLDVLVPRFGEVGLLDRLSAARQRISPAAALTPAGDVYLFGGSTAEAIGLGPCDDKIFALRDTDLGSAEFDSVAAGLPDTRGYNDVGEETYSARCGSTATPVTVEDRAMILVTGGRPRWWESVAHTSQWFLFDPADETVYKKGNLSNVHSSHLAIPLRGGKVVLFGGMVSNGFPQYPSYDVWDPENPTQSQSGDPQYDSSGILAFGSALGDDAVVCGGLAAVVQFPIFTWTPLTTCIRITPGGDARAFDPLPVGLAAASMVELPGNELLVTGGITEVLTDDLYAYSYESGPARGEMYRWSEAGGWQEVGSLGQPRAQHATLSLADGRALIVGGTEDATALFGAVLESVRCAEIYNPATDETRPADCSDAGAGAFPVVGDLPGEGAFVLEGYTIDNGLRVSGITAYGFVSTGPPSLE